MITTRWPWLAGVMLLKLGSTPAHGESSHAPALARRLPTLPQQAAPVAASFQERRPMRVVPAGEYRPFYRNGPNEPPTVVPSFALDLAPVSRAEFAAFVVQSSAWRRSRVDALFAERGYLSDWLSDLDPGPDAARPVVYVSWFAAKAYCAWRDERLPSVIEWEQAQRGGASAAGLSEWTLDFNGVARTAADAVDQRRSRLRRVPSLLVPKQPAR